MDLYSPSKKKAVSRQERLYVAKYVLFLCIPSSQFEETHRLFLCFSNWNFDIISQFHWQQRIRKVLLLHSLCKRHKNVPCHSNSPVPSVPFVSPVILIPCSFIVSMCHSLAVMGLCTSKHFRGEPLYLTIISVVQIRIISTLSSDSQKKWISC